MINNVVDTYNTSKIRVVIASNFSDGFSHFPEDTIRGGNAVSSARIRFSSSRVNFSQRSLIFLFFSIKKSSAPFYKECINKNKKYTVLKLEYIAL